MFLLFGFGMPAIVIVCALIVLWTHNRWLAKQPGYGPNDPKD